VERFDCAALGPVIALVVSLLKGVPVVGDLIARRAKLVAAIAAATAVFLSGAFDPTRPLQLLVCVLEQLAGAIATYEIALKPLRRKVLRS